MKRRAQFPITPNTLKTRWIKFIHIFALSLSFFFSLIRLKTRVKCGRMRKCAPRIHIRSDPSLSVLICHELRKSLFGYLEKIKDQSRPKINQYPKDQRSTLTLLSPSAAICMALKQSEIVSTVLPEYGGSVIDCRSYRTSVHIGDDCA